MLSEISLFQERRSSHALVLWLHLSACLCKATPLHLTWDFHITDTCTGNKCITLGWAWGVEVSTHAKGPRGLYWLNIGGVTTPIPRMIYAHYRNYYFGTSTLFFFFIVFVILNACHTSHYASIYNRIVQNFHHHGRVAMFTFYTILKDDTKLFSPLRLISYPKQQESRKCPSDTIKAVSSVSKHNSISAHRHTPAKSKVLV